jgi:hypothetical protein
MQVFERMALEDSGLPDQMNRRRQEAERFRCSRPDIGDLVAEFGFRFLTEILDLKSQCLATECQIVELTAEERQSLKRKIVEHQETCRRCQAEAEFETWWDETFRNFLGESSKAQQKIIEIPEEPAERPKVFAAGASGAFQVSVTHKPK